MPLWQLTQRPLSFAQAACLVTPLYRRGNGGPSAPPSRPPASPGEEGYEPRSSDSRAGDIVPAQPGEGVGNVQTSEKSP